MLGKCSSNEMEKRKICFLQNLAYTMVNFHCLLLVEVPFSPPYHGPWQTTHGSNRDAHV